jgi:chorismate synthase
MLRYLTAGESHGRAILAILEGLPAGLGLDEAYINRELKRRQQGFGRGARMRLEHDRCCIVSGLKGGKTLGSPIALCVENKDFSIEKLARVACPRPGHADLAGLLKYGFSDARAVLERASARSTVATVAIGSVCKKLLAEFGVKITSHVLSVAGEDTAAGIQEKIREAIREKDTVGGIFAVRAAHVPVGLGSYAQPDRRLDSRIAAQIISIPGIKTIEFGLGLGFAASFGSEVHDEIFYSRQKGYFHKSNNAGGIEGGVSNGEDILLRACMKPISTLLNPLVSVNISSKKPSRASVQRSDTCVVEAAGVVAESALAFVLAEAILEKFGGDSLADIKASYLHYLRRIK